MAPSATPRPPRRIELLEETARLRAEDLARSLNAATDPKVRSLQESAHHAGMMHISETLATELFWLLGRLRRQPASHRWLEDAA